MIRLSVVEFCTHQYLRYQYARTARFASANVALSEFGRDGFFDFPHDYGSPGFWTAYTARARLRNLRLAELDIPAGEALDYARAIRIQRALGESDIYPHERKRAGLNYSPLVLLESREQTDQEFGEISNCIAGCSRSQGTPSLSRPLRYVRDD